MEEDGVFPLDSTGSAEIATEKLVVGKEKYSNEEDDLLDCIFFFK